ncbi:MAG: hypothetical protein IKL62_05655 [Clostridia bacterium]|nr:hypothetical protein [Clostridia bacterium]
MSKQITNVIFFLRHDEPRIPELDLYYTLEKQLETANRYDFPVTYLLEFDSLIDERYTELLKREANEKSEVGGWFEIVEPLCQKAGLAWRGREGFSWDWHCHCGFSVGYTKEERKLLIDTYMAEFKAIFGSYPKSVGCWMIDAFSLEYMEKSYGVMASCNCRDQWGTDGYSLWGGYYGQGYYPSRYNAICPAQTKENQINIPVFRMLGLDYLHSYDCGLNRANGSFDHAKWQPCLTLEPVYLHNGIGGGCPEWVDWYFRENFCENPLSFNYVHVGQENSFLWSAQEQGTIYQFEKLKKLEDEGFMEMQTLSQTAQWYRDTYPLTPASIVKAETDWNKELDSKTLWYNCKNYRLNVYNEQGRVWIRDLMLYDEKYKERYYDEVCTTTTMVYDNLPVVDGNLWSSGGVRSGLYLYLVKNGEEKDLTAISGEVSYPSESSVMLTLKTNDGDTVLITLCEENVTIECETALVSAKFKGVPRYPMPFISAEDDTLYMRHNGYDYNIKVPGIKLLPNGYFTVAANKKIQLLLK